VLRIIREPTSASLSYGLHTRQFLEYCIVFDFGGGTLDISLLSVRNRMFDVLAISGDQRLGGEDFNNNLLKYYLAVLKTDYNITITSKEQLQLLRREFEKAKIELSSLSETQININLENKEISFTLTRNKFEEIKMKTYFTERFYQYKMLSHKQVYKHKILEKLF